MLILLQRELLAVGVEKQAEKMQEYRARVGAKGARIILG
jgi:hypothetical protein